MYFNTDHFIDSNTEMEPINKKKHIFSYELDNVKLNDLTDENKKYNDIYFKQILQDKDIISLKKFISSLEIDNRKKNQHNIISLFLKEHKNYNYDQIFEIVTFLENNDIDFNIRNKIGYTPLKICINNRYEKLAKILIIKYRDIIFTQQDYINDHLLHLAISKSLYETSKILLEYDNEINGNIKNSIDFENVSPLMIAIINNNIPIINLLFEYNVDPNIKNSYGKTALMYACDTTIRVNNKDNKDNNLLHIDIINILLENGVNINIVDNLGQSAIHYACKNIDRDSIIIFNTLLEYGANPNSLDLYDNSPLINLLYDNYHIDQYLLISIMLLLVKYGAILDFKNIYNTGIYDLMSYQFSKIFNIVYNQTSSNLNKKEKINNKLFISKTCLICIEDKEKMILFNDCNHSVICDECYKILLDYNKTKIEQITIDNNDNIDNNFLKCPYCKELVSTPPNYIEYL